MLKKQHIKFLGTICCLLLSNNIYTQNEIKDTSFFKQEVMAYLKIQNLLPKTNWNQFHPLNTLTEKLDKRERGNNLIKLDPSLHLSFDNTYASRDTTIYAVDAPSLYSNIQMNTEVKALGIPIQLSANLIGLDGKLDRGLSSINLSFSPKVFLGDLKSKYFKMPTSEQIINPVQNLLQFSPKELAAIYQEQRFNIYQKVLSNEQFYVHKKELKTKLDSLEKKYHLKTHLDSLQNQVKIKKDSLLELSDSLKTGIDTSLIAKYRKALEIVLQVEQLYQKAWKLRNQKDYQLWAQVKQKTNGYLEEVKALDKEIYVKDQLLKKTDLAKWKKLLLKTKELNLGQFSLDNSDFTTKHVYLRGINYGYASNKFYGQFAYGNQTRPSLFALNSSSSWLGNLGGRKFLFLQAGTGEKEGNHSEVNYLQVNERDAAGDSLFTFPKFNRVLEWDGQLAVNNSVIVHSTIALSDLDLSPTSQDLESGGTWTTDKMATNLEFIYEPNDKGLAIGMGYFYTGARFVTLGNPFLLTNRQGIAFNLTGQLFKNKIQVNTSAKYGKSVNESSFDGFKDYQILGEISAKVGKQSSIRASIMPNIFDQAIYNNQKVRSQSIIYSIQGNFIKKIKELQAVTVVNLTNLRSNFQLLDSAQVSANAYLYVQEMLFISDRQSINTTLMLGSDDISGLAINDLLVQADYNYAWQKIGFSLGLQLIKNPFLENKQYGILGSINTTFSENGMLSFYINYRNDWKEKSEQQAQMAANLSFYYTIKPRQK